MKLVEMRKKFGWSERTLKARKAALQSFLQTNFNGLTLDAFFVDRRIFTAAERQLNEEVFRSRCPGNAGKARFQAPNLPEDYRDVGLDSGSGA